MSANDGDVEVANPAADAPSADGAKTAGGKESDGGGADAEAAPTENYYVGLPAAAAMGLIFGGLFEKAHVFEPRMVRGQFIFERWIMIKMFMGAIAGSSLAFSVLSLAAPSKFDAVRASFHPAQRGYVSGGMLGGSILGAGMAVAGACPSMTSAQVGTGVPDALFTVAGGLLGAFVYGLAEPKLQPAFLSKGGQCAGDLNDYVDVKLNVAYPVLALSFGGLCTAGGVLLEYLVDFRSELDDWEGSVDNRNFPSPEAQAWPPFLCGLLLGLLQIPAGLAVGDSLGASAPYQCAASQWLLVAPQATKSRFRYMDEARVGLGVWWRVFYVVFAVLGAYISAQLSGNDEATYAAGVGPWPALLGGFLVVFGARLGGGCTSGHGISGVPMLNALSMVAVGALFATGIAVALVLDALDVYEIGSMQGRL
jgi:uncharacterized membrane protein YedE/YeeE